MQGHLFLTACNADGSNAGKCFPSITKVQEYNKVHGKTEMAPYQETVVFLQISNSSAILIFSARTLSFFFTSMPAWQLMFSTVVGQVLVNVALLMPQNGLVKTMHAQD